MRELASAEGGTQFDDEMTFNIEDKRITIEDCPAGAQLMGISKGKPVCVELTMTCATGQMMVGISRAQPICQNVPVASAPASGNPTIVSNVSPRSTAASTPPAPQNNDEGWLGQIFREELGRAPRAAGAAYWEAQHAAGMSIADIRASIASGCEANNNCDTEAGQEERINQAVGNLNFENTTGTSANAVATSAAAQTSAAVVATTQTNQYTSTANTVNGLFQKHLGRDARQGGLDYYTNQIIGGRSVADVENEIANSCEAKGTC